MVLGKIVRVPPVEVADVRESDPALNEINERSELLVPLAPVGARLQ